jgi:hypothetical protein
MPGARTWGTRGATVLGVAAFLALAVAPAGATVVERGTFSGSELGVADSICGIDVVRDSTFSGRFRDRVDKASDGQAFLERFNGQFRDVFTNPLNHRSMSIEAKELSNELKATQVAGNVYAFVTIEAGQPFVVRDGDGNVVLRDRGVVRRRVLFDTLGDSTPGGVFVDEEILSVSGPHPGFDQTEAEFCAIVEGLIG